MAQDLKVNTSCRYVYFFYRVSVLFQNQSRMRQEVLSDAIKQSYKDHTSQMWLTIANALKGNYRYFTEHFINFNFKWGISLIENWHLNLFPSPVHAWLDTEFTVGLLNWINLKNIAFIITKLMEEKFLMT